LERVAQRAAATQLAWAARRVQLGGYQNNALAGLAGQQQQPPQQNAMAQERFMLDPRDFMVSNQFSFTPVQA
jgi:hypothetical protein